MAFDVEAADEAGRIGDCKWAERNDRNQVAGPGRLFILPRRSAVAPVNFGDLVNCHRNSPVRGAGDRAAVSRQCRGWPVEVEGE